MSKKHVERLENQRLRAQKRYNKKCVTKVSKKLLLATVVYLVAVALETIAMFKVWDYFNPTADYLEFIVWGFMFGILFYTLTYAVVETSFKKWWNKARLTAKIERRRINRFYEYEKKEFADK